MKRAFSPDAERVFEVAARRSLQGAPHASRHGGDPTKPAKGDTDTENILHSPPQQLSKVTIERNGEIETLVLTDVNLDIVLPILRQFGTRAITGNDLGERA